MSLREEWTPTEINIRGLGPACWGVGRKRPVMIPYISWHCIMYVAIETRNWLIYVSAYKFDIWSGVLVWDFFTPSFIHSLAQSCALLQGHTVSHCRVVGKDLIFRLCHLLLPYVEDIPLNHKCEDSIETDTQCDIVADKADNINHMPFHVFTMGLTGYMIHCFILSDVCGKRI